MNAIASAMRKKKAGIEIIPESKMMNWDEIIDVAN